MTFGGKGYWEVIGKLASPDVERMVGTALDAGVNFIDTADVYSEGESETLLGAALASLKRPRESLVVATKVRGRSGPGPNQIGLSRAHIMASVDDSLRRLKLDFIDLYQIHGMDRATPIEETLSALDDLVHDGKVRAIGFCNLPAWLASQAIVHSDSKNLARFQSAQVYYSIAGRDIEREIVPLAEHQRVAILPWSPLAGGLLSGKFDFESQGPADARRAKFDFPPVDRTRAAACVKAMRPVAEATGSTVARVALAWVLSRPFVTSVIIGAKTNEQLLDNLAAAELHLAKEQIAELDRVSALPAEYPGWMLDWQDRDRRPNKS